MTITGRMRSDQNFVYVYTDDAVWTKAKATGEWGCRKIGECGYDRKSHECNRDLCEENGSFEIPD